MDEDELGAHRNHGPTSGCQLVGTIAGASTFQFAASKRKKDPTKMIGMAFIQYF
jgi:hypothetical protein